MVVHRTGLYFILIAVFAFPLFFSIAGTTETRAQSDSPDGVVIVLDGEVTPGLPRTENGLPVEGYGCENVYWRDGEPEYQNRVSVLPFTVDVTATYRVFLSNGIRTPVPEPDRELTPEEEIALENAFPRPYVMLYEAAYLIDHPTAFCLWAARDERTPYLTITLETEMPYFLVVSHEGNEPEWSFRYHVTIERIIRARNHICYGLDDPVCMERNHGAF